MNFDDLFFQFSFFIVVTLVNLAVLQLNVRYFSNLECQSFQSFTVQNFHPYSFSMKSCEKFVEKKNNLRV